MVVNLGLVGTRVSPRPYTASVLTRHSFAMRKTRAGGRSRLGLLEVLLRVGDYGRRDIGRLRVRVWYLGRGKELDVAAAEHAFGHAACGLARLQMQVAQHRPALPSAQ